MNVTRIMSKKGKITIVYTEYTGKDGSEEKHSVESSDMPTAKFSGAFSAMKKLLLKLVDLPEKEVDKIHLERVDIKYTGEEYVSLSITGSRDIQNSKSGHKLESPWYGRELKKDNEEEDKNVLSLEGYNLLQTLLAEAKNFLTGDRSQRVFEFPNKEEEEEEIEEPIISIN